MPVLMLVGGLFSNCEQLLLSLSDYYHTPMRNIFVGLLFAVAFFLFSYKGRTTSIWWLRENLFANLGGLLAIFTALFPTISDCKVACNIPIAYAIKYESLLVLSYFCLVLFKEKDELIYCGPNLINVKRRNLTFKLCGYIMLISMGLTALFFAIAKVNTLNCEYKQTYDLVFWSELIMLWAFGISWLVKGLNQLFC